MRKTFFALSFAAVLSHGSQPSVPDSGGIPSRREGPAYAWAALATLVPTLAGIGVFATEPGNGMEALGGALIVGGTIVGPSAGELYAGAYGRGAMGSALRVLGGALFLTGAASNVPSMSCLEREPGEPACDEGSGDLPMIVGGALYLGATAFSLIDTHLAFRGGKGPAGTPAPAARSGFAPSLAAARSGISPGLAAWARF